MRPRLGEINQGAMVGAMVGAIGGLFAMGAAGAIIERSPAILFETPILSLIGWFASGLSGWFLGGQFGPRLGMAFRSQRAETVGGVIGGFIPFLLIAYLGWRIYLHAGVQP